VDAVHPIQALNRTLRSFPPIAIFAIALLGVAAVGIPDHLVGFEISLSVFYLVPVGFSSWYGGKVAGTLIAVVSSLSALSESLIRGLAGMRPGVLAWNGFLHFGFMIVVVLLLDRLHQRVEIEHQLARSDAVTGIFNRLAFFEQLKYLLDLAARERNPIALAYIDLDNFKRVNDEHGHDEGDRILRRVAHTLRQSTRRTDVVARLGGDEFVVLMPGVDDSAASGLVNKIHDTLSQALGGGASKTTCSIGCVVFQQPPGGADFALKSADALMYKVKSEGKNAVAIAVIGDQSTRLPIRRRG